MVTHPLAGLPFLDLFDTLLPDFVLGFTFFTALGYVVLGRHFRQQRPVIALCGALGLALAFSLVWWEQRTGLSIRDLGPFAVGFAIILLGLVMYHAIRPLGGGWAGAGIALGASLMVSMVLGLAWPAAAHLLRTVATVALLAGVMAFLVRGRGRMGALAPMPAERRRVRHDMRDLEEERDVAGFVGRQLRTLRNEADLLERRPEVANDLLVQLKRMVPAEGWLTERLARLRERACFVRRGHIARIAELRDEAKDLPPAAMKRAARELSARYAELKLDLRLDRLDAAVAAFEKQVQALSRQAATCLAAHRHREVPEILKQAEGLQGHNRRLLATIERTEGRLLALARDAAKTAREVTPS